MKNYNEVQTQIQKTTPTHADIKSRAEAIFHKMKQELAAMTPANKLQKAKLSFQIAISAANDLKREADGYQFESESAEISFYKITYVDLLEDVYYFTLKYEFEAHAPYKDVHQKANYLRDTLKRHKYDLDKQHFFYNYIYLDESHMNAKYFCRHSDIPTPPDMAIGFCNYAFPCDYYAHKFARIHALIRHINELHLELTALNDDGVTTSKTNDNGLVWTDAKVALIELSYALFEEGSINKGNVTLKRIISAFEQLFNISLDNYLTLFKQSIRMRKESRTLFLEALISSLSKRMDKYDEKMVRQ